MSVVVTDYTFPALDVEKAVLEPLGCEVVGRQCKTPHELIQLVSQADAVLTQFASVNRTVIDSMQRARVIVRYGIGVDNVDLEAARAKNIPVCNVPDYCIDEVADHTLALILTLTRQTTLLSNHLHAGKWGVPTPLASMRVLKELTVGVVGFGRIGREVVARLQPFNGLVQVFDPMVPPDEIRRSGARPVALEELIGSSDLVTLHCPSNAKTRRMFDARAFNVMKPGSLFVNIGRGDLVETAALTEALHSGRLAGAALDVCDPEPIPKDSPLLTLDNVILTPHIASASVTAAAKLRSSAAALAAKAIRGEPLHDVVNGVRS